MNQFISDFNRIRIEERKTGRPHRAAALAILACIPLLYCWIFISSMQDPYGNLPHLPAALVDGDLGVEYRGKDYRLGRELSKSLIEQKPVDWIVYADEEEAREAVRRGSAYFALILPEDFSARALAAEGGRKARIELYASAGGNYFASRVGRSIADKVAASMNAQLGEGRWEAVGAALPQLASGVGALKDATDKLADGSAALASGGAALSSAASRLAGGLVSAAEGSAALAAGNGSLALATGRLADGVGQLGGGVRQLEAAAPGDAQLKPLADGAATLASGSKALAEGLGKLASGVDSASKKAGLLGAGLKQAAPKIEEASGAARRVAEGNANLAQGIATLSGGMSRMKGALGAMSAKLPGDAELASLKSGAATLAEKSGALAEGVQTLSEGAAGIAGGAKALAEGAGSLSGGIALMRSRLPPSLEAPSGDAAGLAASVAVEEEDFAAVTDNGEAFAPYAMAISLWIGMLMATFVFDFRRAPGAPRLAFIAQRLSGPAALALAQALVLYAGLWATGLRYEHPFLTIASQATAGLCYLAIIYALVAYLGDAGKLLSVILLVLQIGASGGSFPIELAPPFYRAIYGYLPIGDAITALRFGLSGACEGRLGVCLLKMTATGSVMLGLSLLGKRRPGAIAEAVRA